MDYGEEKELVVGGFEEECVGLFVVAGERLKSGNERKKLTGKRIFSKRLSKLKK